MEYLANFFCYVVLFDAFDVLLVYSYLENRQQRVKINGSFSNYKHVQLGAPQGSVLGPLFFNIYINDLLLSIQETDICNYADDTTIYTCDILLESVISMLENDSKIIIEWFGNNYMKLNEDKCNFMIFGERTNQDISINIGNCCCCAGERTRPIFYSLLKGHIVLLRTEHKGRISALN